MLALVNVLVLNVTNLLWIAYMTIVHWLIVVIVVSMKICHQPRKSQHIITLTLALGISRMIVTRTQIAIPTPENDRAIPR